MLQNVVEGRRLELPTPTLRTKPESDPARLRDPDVAAANRVNR